MSSRKSTTAQAMIVNIIIIIMCDSRRVFKVSKRIVFSVCRTRVVCCRMIAGRLRAHKQLKMSTQIVKQPIGFMARKKRIVGVVFTWVMKYSRAKTC